MHARTLLAGLATASVAASVLAMSPSPAFAVYTAQADDTRFAATPTDLVGVGSDTSQNALKRLAEAYNATSPASRIATYAALGGGTIPMPSGAEINRPNGSGGGKTLLYGAANDTRIDFARSSSAQSATETTNGLQSFPFALDTLGMAVSNSTPSNAPAALTEAQIVDIYDGDAETWNEVGGSSTAAIVPMIPQANSGTRSFFELELKRMNGGVAIQLADTVQEVQEHDDTLIKSNPNAIAPFSVGRAGLLGTTLRFESGFTANRALYNVVRGSDIGKPEIQDAFGTGGFLCSTEAKPLIEAAGFKQLATPAKGGVCGTTTQTATTDFDLNDATPVDTTVAVTVASTEAAKAKITAKVAGGATAPSGSVSFFKNDGTVLARNVAVAGGQATYTAGSAVGAQTFRAVYRPAAGTNFKSSQATGSGTVKAGSKVVAKFPKSAKAGKKVKGTVTVKLTGISAKAAGTVKVKAGSKTVGSGKLKNGKVTLTLKGLKAGTNKLKAIWTGDAAAVGSQDSFKVKVAKAKK
jgi:ABC-type phosphate transport system substrate-binding protein